jgi:hypothetical protein
MHDLETENRMLKFQVQQQQQMVADQQLIIEAYKANLKKKADASCQTVELPQKHFAEDIITDRKADLLIEIESLQRRLKRMETKIEYHKNKENKFLFFLFTLQNKGIQVNEMYEKEGIKDIPTNRFAEIMAEDQQAMQNN